MKLIASLVVGLAIDTIKCVLEYTFRVNYRKTRVMIDMWLLLPHRKLEYLTTEAAREPWFMRLCNPLR